MANSAAEARGEVRDIQAQADAMVKFGQIADKLKL
jgi:hypothetical protein